MFIKKIARKIIEKMLKWEAFLILKKYRPKIIGVTGTVGKTSAKDAIALVMGSKFSFRKSEKSYNSELGVPLTIIGAKSGWGSFLGWILVLIRGFELIVKRKSRRAGQDYPEWLILEMGVDRPGDMKKMASWIKPEAVVVTKIGETPVHVEYFESPAKLGEEKAKIVKALSPEKWTALNGDDSFLIDLKDKVRANVIYYGFSEVNDLRASNYLFTPEGITFKVEYKSNIVPVRLKNIFGKHHVYTALAALAVGLSQGLNLVEMAGVLADFKGPPGRLNLLEGIKDTSILDDTYNASPAAMEAAFDVMKESPCKRKVVVLGDMLELGKYTIDEHKKIGKMVKANKVGLFFAVGMRMKFAAEAAREAGFNKKNIFEFSTADEARMAVQEKIKAGDLILVKGSQSMRMEKVVEEIMLHPEKKEELLVRQEPEWVRR